MRSAKPAIRPLSGDAAIIGIDCRAAGAPDRHAFWRTLIEGGIHTGPWPVQRWRLSELWARDWGNAVPPPRTLRAMHGAYLDAVDAFDAAFFGISAREAAAIDPQHRLILQACWRALQDAALDPRRLAGSATGVFVALSSMDYALLGHEAGATVGAYAALGASKSLAANRVSHALDLAGPSMAIDSACSSGLVALHLARRALAAGECDLAIVAGANLVLAPTVNAAFARAGMLSSRGLCTPFRSGADGYLRGEGVAALVLKRLGEAVDNGDPVHAVLIGSAVNQDGRTPGITVPAAEAQVAVVQAAWADAGVGADDIDLHEAHGTGTPVGDSAEIDALAAVFETRTRAAPCLVGSLKANFGHVEAAAGLFGVVKVATALATGIAPPHAGEGAPAHWPAHAHGRLHWPEAAQALRPSPQPWHGSVSAFGFGGTNAHVVLRAAPPARLAAATRLTLPLSAHNPGALRQLAEAWARAMEAADAPRAAALSFSARRAYAGERIRICIDAANGADAARQVRNAAARIGDAEAAAVKRGVLVLGAPGAAVGASGGTGIAAQLRLLQQLQAVLPGWPVHSMGAHPLALALWRGQLDATGALARLEAGDNGPPGAIDIGAEAWPAGLPALGIGVLPQHVLRNTGLFMLAPGEEAASVLGALWQAGADVRLDAWAPPAITAASGAPPYAFEPGRYWHAVGTSNDTGLQPATAADALETIPLDLGALAYLAQHRIDGEVVVPGAVLLDLALTAAARSRCIAGGTWRAHGVHFEAPLFVGGTAPSVSLALRPVAAEDGAWAFLISESSGHLTRRIASGHLRQEPGQEQACASA